MIQVFYSGGNSLWTAQNHFKNVEEKMLQHFKGLEKNYGYEFDEWILRIWSNEDPEEKYEIDLTLCFKWEFDEELGIKFNYGEDRRVLFFEETPMLFEGETKKIELTGMRLLR